MTYNKAYTLIELAISLAILSLILSSGLTIFDKLQVKSKNNETVNKLNVIEDAIENFVKINGYIPCPSSIESLESEVGFGDSGSVYDSNSHTCSITYEVGMLPSKQLGLSGEYVFDGWGNKFIYRVATGLGSNLDFSKLGEDGFRGDIRIIDTQGNELTEINKPYPNNYGAAYVIVSYGKNGYGARGRNLNSMVQNPLPQANSLEFENTDHTNKVYIDGQIEKDFDDIVRYKKKNELVNLTYARSPINIPSRVCHNAELMLDKGITGLTSVNLENYLLDAAKATKLLCDNQLLPNCDLNPENVQGENLILWLEGKYPDTGVPNDGDNVCFIKDRSGSSFNLGMTSSICPKYSTFSNFGRSRPGIVFDNNDIIGNFGVLNNSEYTIFLVATKSSDLSPILSIGSNPLSLVPVNNQQLMIFGDKATQGGDYLGIRDGYMIENGEAILLIYSFDQNRHLFKLRTKSNHSYEIEDNNNSSLSHTNFIHLAPNIPGIPTKYQGYVGEVIIYNVNLSKINRQLIEDYLFKKWFSGECDFNFN